MYSLLFINIIKRWSLSFVNFVRFGERLWNKRMSRQSVRIINVRTSFSVCEKSFKWKTIFDVFQAIHFGYQEIKPTSLPPLPLPPTSRSSPTLLPSEVETGMWSNGDGWHMAGTLIRMTATVIQMCIHKRRHKWGHKLFVKHQVMCWIQTLPHSLWCCALSLPFILCLCDVVFQLLGCLALWWKTVVLAEICQVFVFWS